MLLKIRLSVLVIIGSSMLGCRPGAEHSSNTVALTAPAPKHFPDAKTALCCESRIPNRFKPTMAALLVEPSTNVTHEQMVWIPRGTFAMGGDNKQAQPDEYPKHKVTVHGFWMDATEVTNEQFARFVKATGYVTTAERKPDWEVLKKQLAPGTPKLADSLLVAASLVCTSQKVRRFK